MDGTIEAAGLGCVFPASRLRPRSLVAERPLHLHGMAPRCSEEPRGRCPRFVGGKDWEIKHGFTFGWTKKLSALISLGLLGSKFLGKVRETSRWP